MFDFNYTSSIDEETYNQVKLTYDNEKTGRREIYIAKHGANINVFSSTLDAILKPVFSMYPVCI